MPPSKLSPQLLALTPLVGKAMGDHQMIQARDRILVEVPGGRNSILLLEMLRHFQRVAPIEFEIRPVFMDVGLPRFPVSKLKKYFESTHLPFEIVKVKKNKNKSRDEIAFPDCSGEQREALLELARRLGFNKIAMGCDLDLIAETILINLFFSGQIGALSPHQKFRNECLAIICPLAYVRAAEIRQLARRGGVPEFAGSRGPADRDPRRRHIRRLIKELERDNPSLKRKIVGSLRNIRHEYLF